MSDPKDDFYDMDLEHDLGDGGLGSGNWMRRQIEHEEKGGGWITCPEDELNPTMAEREERAETEER